MSRRSSTSSTSSGPFSLTDLSGGLQRFATNISPLIDVEVNLKWLRNSNNPWKLVEENWNITVHVRLNKIASKDGQSIVEYMTEYPPLEKLTGYLLVRMEFSIIFLGNI